MTHVLYPSVSAKCDAPFDASVIATILSWHPSFATLSSSSSYTAEGDGRSVVVPDLRYDDAELFVLDRPLSPKVISLILFPANRSPDFCGLSCLQQSNERKCIDQPRVHRDNCRANTDLPHNNTVCANTVAQLYFPQYLICNRRREVTNPENVCLHVSRQERLLQSLPVQTVSEYLSSK
jgi:hypothetical protein